MKRAVAVALLFLAFGVGVAQAGGGKIGIGAYGGLSIPIIQDDTGGGTIFGARVPLRFIPVVTLEPFYASSSLKDVEESFASGTYTRSGFDETAFGVNAILGSISGGGMKFYPFGGFGSYKLTREGSEDLKETGWDFGLGLGIPAGSSLSIQIRGEIDMIVTGDTSRKFGNVTAGLNYNFPMGGGGGSAKEQSAASATAPPTASSAAPGSPTPAAGAATGAAVAADSAGAAGQNAAETPAAAPAADATPAPTETPEIAPSGDKPSGGQK